MSNINIKPEGNAVKSVPRADVKKMFEEFYPEWAVDFAIDSMMDIEDFEFIDMGHAPFAFKVMDIETAVIESKIGGFDSETWTDDDEDDAITSWLEDIEANLDGLVVSRQDGHESEFLVKNL